MPGTAEPRLTQVAADGRHILHRGIVPRTAQNTRSTCPVSDDFADFLVRDPSSYPKSLRESLSTSYNSEPYRNVSSLVASLQLGSRFRSTVVMAASTSSVGGRPKLSRSLQVKEFEVLSLHPLHVESRTSLQGRWLTPAIVKPARIAPQRAAARETPPRKKSPRRDNSSVFGSG